jgi:hypothetical protein
MRCTVGADCRCSEESDVRAAPAAITARVTHSFVTNLLDQLTGAIQVLRRRVLARKRSEWVYSFTCPYRKPKTADQGRRIG